MDERHQDFMSWSLQPSTFDAAKHHHHHHNCFNPAVQDEVTNGLDSNMALAIVKSLKNICVFAHVGFMGKRGGGGQGDSRVGSWRRSGEKEGQGELVYVYIPYDIILAFKDSLHLFITYTPRMLQSLSLTLSLQS